MTDIVLSWFTQSVVTK